MGAAVTPTRLTQPWHLLVTRSPRAENHVPESIADTLARLLAQNLDHLAVEAVLVLLERLGDELVALSVEFLGFEEQLAHCREMVSR